MQVLMFAEANVVHTQRWALALRDRGYRVSLLSLGSGAIDGVEILPLKVPAWSWKYPGRWGHRYAQLLRRLIEEVDPTVIHVHYLRDYPLMQAAGKTPVVVSAWGSDVVIDAHSPPEADAQRELKVALLQQAAAVTATNRYLARKTTEYGDIPIHDVDVIPFGVDLSRFWPKTADAERIQAGYRRVGFVKHLEPRYGIEHFVRSAAQIVSSIGTVDFVVAGDGSQAAAMRALAQELGLGPRITWLGDVPHDRVPVLLRSLDVLVMPSLAEAFGVVAIEAQAVGTPVVCYDIPGVDEAVHAGVGGYRVPSGNIEALSRMTVRLLLQREDRERLGQRGRSFVKRQFDFSDNVDAMVKVYERVVACRTIAAGA